MCVQVTLRSRACLRRSRHSSRRCAAQQLDVAPCMTAWQVGEAPGHLPLVWPCRLGSGPGFFASCVLCCGVLRCATPVSAPLAVRRHHLPLLPPEEAVRRGGLPPLQQAQHDGRVHRQDRLLPLPLRHWPLLPRLPAHPLRPDPRGGCSSSSVRHTSRRWPSSRQAVLTPGHVHSWPPPRRAARAPMHGSSLMCAPAPAQHKLTPLAACLPAAPHLCCPAGGARADGRGLLALPPLLRGGAPRGGLDVQQQHLHEEAWLQAHRWAILVHGATQATNQRMGQQASPVWQAAPETYRQEWFVLIHEQGWRAPQGIYACPGD